MVCGVIGGAQAEKDQKNPPPQNPPTQNGFSKLEVAHSTLLQFCYFSKIARLMADRLMFSKKCALAHSGRYGRLKSCFTDKKVIRR